MKILKLNKGLSRDEMRAIKGGTAVAEYQCWCDGIRNRYCDGSISGSHAS